MKIFDLEQRSPEWYAVRCGIPTASNFDKIITTKGEPSKSRTKYLYQLAGERITGIQEETYQSAAMQKGIEREAEARINYEFITDSVVNEVGFCLSDGYGASPDGLIGEGGGIEIKCPNLATHVGYLLSMKLPIEYFQQVQGCMLVADRDWWDFMSYYPGIKPLIVRVKREEIFIELLKVELASFCNELEDITRKIM